MPTAAQPLTVSVIVPTYNRADMLVEALDSVLRQTRLPEEVIVVDDGSSDGTREVLARYGSPVVVMHQSNSGVSTARNRAIDAAMGDVLVFLDSDDLLLPNYLERIVAEFAARPEIDVLYPDMIIIDGDGNPLGTYSGVTRGLRSGDLLGDLAGQCLLNMSASAVRRAGLGSIRFDQSLACAEDYKFWCQLAARSLFHYLDEPLACYRYHGAQATTLRVRQMLEDALGVQLGVMNMPEFARATRRQRSHAFTTHGVKHALCDRTGVARLYFWKALQTNVSNANAAALLGFSLLGGSFLRWTINTRRRLRGNYIEDRAIRLTTDWSATQLHEAARHLMPSQAAPSPTSER